MEVQTHMVTGGAGTTLSVKESGQATGQPILFIHGFSQCWLAWRKQLDADLANEYRLVALDLRGHGRSEKPQEGYGDAHLWADDIHAVITTLQLEQPVLVGWSYGGIIIADYVGRYGDGHLRGINLVGALTSLGTDAAMQQIGPAFLALLDGFFAPTVAESVAALEQFMHLMVAAELSEEDFYTLLGYNAMVPPAVRQGLLMRTVDNSSVLGTMQTPVLLTHGRDDQIILPMAAEQHAAAIANTRISWYAQCGHAPFLEDAPRFNQELRAFIRGL
jgi:pimeloyl-ACP methyl ester carboxylesterase